ncbi:CBS domain-containing protein [Desulfobacula sp.]|uniref:CBS domain-containing protein n=1 Tax=Desulfobacula sp. TaxID=2593537 RepID=UPI00261E4BB0|nr:CBS domain-containing protein [Desulfobacula sp.]
METDNTKIVRTRDVMNKQILTVDGMATAREAAAIMRSERVFSLLVTKRHENDAWGILVVQDFVKGVIIPGRSPDDVNVYEIMTKPIITVPADMDIRYAARLIYRAGIRRAPVEDKGEIVGMISLSSLILDNDLF